jgi:outer membrane receptor protein involved in Fe transport
MLGKALTATIAALIGALLAPLPALAAEGEVVLQEIVVTAQKRVEDLQRVPISISVLDNAAFDRLSITNLADVAAYTPGLDYYSTGPKNLFAIRGIFSGGGASTTAIYIDDVPVQVRVGIVGLIGATLPEVFDLERVEVLRGPQGTLFGSSAEGGAIRFITPEPGLTHYSGYSRADVGYTEHGDPSYEAGAAFGGPLIDQVLGFRVSAWHRRDGGYVDHESAIPGGYQERNSNWEDSDVLRLALALAPTAGLRITPSLYYQHNYSHDSSGFEPAGSAADNDAYVSEWGGVLTLPFSNVGAGKFVNPQFEQVPSSDQFYVPALHASLDLAGGLQLVSNLGYLHRSNTTREDFTTATPGGFGLPWPTVAAAADYNLIETVQNVLSEDLRLQSASGGTLEWTFGLNFVDSRELNFNPEVAPYFPNYLPGSVLLQGNVSYIGIERANDKQVAAYGQLTYHITHQWSVTAGARVAHDSDDYSIYQTGPFAGGTSYVAGVQGETVKDPKFGVNYQLDENVLLYVSASKGDRVGGVNAPFPFTPNCAAVLNEIGLSSTPPTYRGDSLWSYEIGSKSRFLDNHVQLDLSAFHIDWSNVQQAISLPSSVCSETFTGNLGKARSNGFELELQAKEGPVTFDLAVGYVKATNTQSLAVTTPPASPGGPPSIVEYVSSGQQVNPYGTPWTVVPAVEYEHPIAGYSAYLRVDDEFHSKNPGPFAQGFPNNVSYDPNFIANPSTNVLNLHVGMRIKGWDASLYALNALDAHPLLFNTSLETGQFIGPTYTLRPRSLGARAIYRW